MDPRRWEQIEKLLQKALDLNPSERAAFFSQNCVGDEALRQEVESLLGTENEEGSFLESSALEIIVREMAVIRSTSLTGERIGHYQIQSLLGEGGMGKVYLATDTLLHRQVALKTLPIDFPDDVNYVHRLEQEARIIAALNHPNIINIYETGNYEKWYFIVSELIEGQTLRQQIISSRLGVRDAVFIAIQIASALQAAHAVGVIHCDIKPENIMLRPDGMIKVLDFGLATLDKTQWLVDDQGQAARSKTGISIVKGTVTYMSPEQALGQELDARTDLFSLGLVIYELITGQRPFAGKTRAEIIQWLLNENEVFPLSFPHDMPSSLEKIISKSLKKNRDERYTSANEMLEDLHKVLP